MAIFDVFGEFSDGQDLTTTSLSDNVLNFGAADLEMGAGEPLWLCVKIGPTQFDSAGGTTTIALYRHTTATVNSGTVIWQTPALSYTLFTAGAWIIRMPLPYNVDEDAFIGLYYTIATTFTTGSIDAWLNVGPPATSFDTQVSASNI